MLKLEADKIICAHLHRDTLDYFRGTDRICVPYHAGIFPADFEGVPDAERIRMNKWVEEKTNGKIKDLLDEGCLYFWRCEFRRPDKFT